MKGCGKHGKTLVSLFKHMTVHYSCVADSESCNDRILLTVTVLVLLHKLSFSFGSNSWSSFLVSFFQSSCKVVSMYIFTFTFEVRLIQNLKFSQAWLQGCFGKSVCILSSKNTYMRRNPCHYHLNL